MYLVEKTINKLNSYGHTFFLKPNELDEVTRHLKKNSYVRFFCNYRYYRRIVYDWHRVDSGAQGRVDL